ncbi:MAG: class I poly(R)-hydroxyalkanoic acid synthase [Alphaproteobacteria bacterium]|nr:class I poly(R)-hydroxyalkanoic acid synthase [Alphaproteobacteria bacterium]
MAERSKTNPVGETPLDPFNLRGASMAMLDHMLQQPEKLTEAQFTLWRNYMSLWDSTLTRLTGGHAADVVESDPADRRFKAEAWHKDALFGFIRQSYLLTARWLLQLVEQNSGTLEPMAARKLQFFTKQFIDAMSPTNFAMTNPDVLQATLESGGQNLVRGMRNLCEDMKRGHLTMTDENAFKLGENIATTKGQVVFRNHMLELIHYAPAGDKVYETPLLIVAPWINKYYILDLRPDNSFVKWCVDQGHSVFMVSWVNPDATLRDVGFDDYMKDGIVAALDAIKKQTGAKSANVVGYCIGGTLLSMTLAWLKAKKKDGAVKSATFLTTLIDFENSGDLKLFVDEQQLELLHDKMSKQGFMDADTMKATFNMLRANDLIWSFVVNNYLLGREPFRFDLLYWNSDSTNLPAKMHEYYLRHMYLNNDLAKAEKLNVGGVKLDLGTIKTPCYFLSTRDDHIAPWKATYEGAKLMAGPVTFTLAGSGHIAGVINHPAAKKYNHWTSSAMPKKPEAWLEKASAHEGSWWPHWNEWLKEFAGKKVAAIDPAKGPLKPLCPAPGTYVKVKA